MVQHKPTPEEQLLKLIENPESRKEGGKETAAPSKDKSRTAGGKGFAFPSWGKLQGIFSYWKTSVASKEPKRQTTTRTLAVNIKWVNHVLMALVLASLLYLVMDLFVLDHDREAYLAQVSTSDAVYPVIPADSGIAKKDLNYYQEPLARRNPFLSPSFEPVEEAAETVSAPARPKHTSIQEVVQTVKLVGISVGSDGPIAMIEETATGRTYFLKRGQEVNGLKIQAIDQEKVTVTYEGEETQLY